ncbi:MAG: hypothetical protein QXX35_02930 [Desulfurococcaceae archaeon]
MKLFNESDLDKIVKEYVRKTTWLIKTSKRRRDLGVEESFQCSNGFLAFIKVSRNIYQLPIICSEEEPVKQLLEKNLFVKKRSLYCFEAEYSTRYISFMNEVINNSKGRVKFKDYYSIDYETVSAEPLSFEGSNVVCKHTLSNGVEVVVKGYRLIREPIIEPLIYEKLFNKNYENMPRIYRVYYYEDNDVRKYLSIITEYVKGCSLSDWFENSMMKMFTEKSSKAEYGEKLFRLNIRLGSIIADLHLKLNNNENDELFGFEDVTDKDIENWIKRIDMRYNYVLNEIKNIVEENEDKSSGHEKEILEFFYKQLDTRGKSIVEYSKGILQKYYLNTLKGRIHQEPILKRIMIRDDFDLRIIDFEGESFRSRDELLMKEPLVRDLATIINSYYTHILNVYNEKHKSKSLLSNMKKICNQKLSETWIWSIRNAIYLIHGYVGYIVDKGFEEKLLKFTVDKSVSIKTYYHVLLTPWIVDRALYEAYYKLQTGSFDYIIPIVTVLNPVFPIVNV